MAIVKPAAMDFSQKNIIMILSGLPGTGKTTLALSAPDVLLIDTDEGMCRVKPEHRKDASICKTYEDVLADIKAAEGTYKTIVIDTCGALIDYMKDWAIRTDPKASKQNGGFSLQGYGVIKQEFLRLSAELRKKFNVIFLFHESMTKNNEDIFYELVVEGSTRTLVYQPADIAGHLFIQNGKRFIGFTPTEQYSAKAAYGIRGIVEVPELKDGDANDFLTKLFVQIRKNLKKESDTAKVKTDAYANAMEEGTYLINDLDTPEKVQPCKNYIDSINDGSTAKEELMQLLRNKLTELNIGYDRKNKVYVWKKK